MAPIFDPCEVYRNGFAKIAHMGHGLWHPSKTIEIGDVGYIKEGAFTRLFNATKQKEVEAHHCGDALVCPAAFTTYTAGYLKPDTYQSNSVKAVGLLGGPGM